MTSDDNSTVPPGGNPPTSSSAERPEGSRAELAGEPRIALQPVEHSVLFAGDPFAGSEQLSGDPLASIDLSAGELHRRSVLFPEDLRISWSWAHFFVFLFFAAVSIVAVQIGFALYMAAGHHWTAQEMQRALEADPTFLVVTNVLWFASLILFLYVTLGVLRDAPFWESLGWRKLYNRPVPDLATKGQPWMYFIAGCGLSLFVAVAGSRVKEPEHVPMQEFFKSRNSAMLLMAMAVLIAPLVEETVFRGYLYPLFATKISSLAARFGFDPQRALRCGTVSGIVITGLLFGLAHGAQLGWTWGFVSLLAFVGIIFTFARAWTGTVLASFLLHLGYNSTIAITTIVATHGFTRLPAHP